MHSLTFGTRVLIFSFRMNGWLLLGSVLCLVQLSLGQLPCVFNNFQFQEGDIWEEDACSICVCVAGSKQCTPTDVQPVSNWFMYLARVLTCYWLAGNSLWILRMVAQYALANQFRSPGWIAIIIIAMFPMVVFEFRNLGVNFSFPGTKQRSEMVKDAVNV